MFGTSGDNCYLRGGDESSLVYIYRISTQLKALCPIAYL